MLSSLVTATVGPRVGALASRVGSTPFVFAGAVATVAASLVFLDIGETADYKVIVASRLLNGLGFALAYPTLNIQALSGVRESEQGLASGLAGSSFQIGGALVLAVTTATTLAHTPEHATAAQTVHGFETGVFVTAATGALLVLLALAGLVAERRRRAQRATEIVDNRTDDSDPLEALRLKRAA